MRRTIREEGTAASLHAPEHAASTAGTDDRGKAPQSDTPKLLHQLRGDLDWIVMKCLEKDRTRRYETANGLAADIQRHLNNEPVVARPPSSAYRLQKAWRRNQTGIRRGCCCCLRIVGWHSAQHMASFSGDRRSKSRGSSPPGHRKGTRGGR